MKLYIPEQSESVVDAFPSHPRKVKKWLAALPQSNMGEMTRQIFNAVRQLNRQKMSNKQRLENMEMLRKPTREIFQNLEKYFINLTLPLPDKRAIVPGRCTIEYDPGFNSATGECQVFTDGTWWTDRKIKATKVK